MISNLVANVICNIPPHKRSDSTAT